MRSLDKDRVVAEALSQLVSRSAADRNLAEPVFVVATQTLEVGADLDFDALVTECASLDALRQRFGRLNRTGRAIEGIDDNAHPVGAKAVVIAGADQIKPGADDPVYGLAIGGTWRELIRLADEDGIVDFGIAHFDADALPQNPENQILAPSLNAPVMLPSHIDAWVQTSPEPTPVPEPALFLHGPERASADVRVCWRADIALDTMDDVARSVDTLALVPPAVPETLPVPIGVMRRWLLGDEADESSDIEGAVGDATENGRERTTVKRAVLRWVGASTDSRLIKSPFDLRPGDTLVIPADIGQEDALGDFGAAGDTSAHLDLGDEAFVFSRAKANLRIHPELIGRWPISDDELRERWAAYARGATARLDDDPDGLLEELRELLANTVDAVADCERSWFSDAINHFATQPRQRLKTLLLRHPSLTGLVLQGRKLLPRYLGGADRFTDEDDAQASGTVDVPLLPVEGDASAKAPRAHLPGVARYARRFAWGCSLPEPVADAIERAGFLHDIGKLDPRFQCLLVGGNCWSVDPDRPLAKSMSVPRDSRARERARTAAAYPKGARHELYSVALAQSDESGSVLPHSEPARSLILHLIASHHGRCRPFAPVIEDEGIERISVDLGGATLTHEGPTGLERLDSGISERFWVQVRRYGWWGSAWLEAILRLADHRRSEYEQRGEQ